MANFRLSCHQITWGRELDKALEDISHYGYRGTETFATVVDDFAGREDELRHKFKSHNLQLTALYGGGDMHIAGKEQEIIDWNIKIAKFIQSMGADRLVLGPGRPRPEGGPTKQHIKTMAAVATEIASASLDYGVITGIHPHWNTPVQERDEISSIFDAVDTDLVKMVLDPAHIAKANADPVEVCETYGDIITYVHIKDYSPDLDTEEANTPDIQGNAPSLAFFSELGEGIVDTPGFVNQLRKNNYDGWLTIELDRTQTSPRQSLENNTRYLTDVMKFDISGDNA
tara:strand:- start:574 stop:1428 length:855 start_codon:yes stop_codon:yes gene_type:complete